MEFPGKKTEVPGSSAGRNPIDPRSANHGNVPAASGSDAGLGTDGTTGTGSSNDTA